jgi:hypothetical protein
VNEENSWQVALPSLFVISTYCTSLLLLLPLLLLLSIYI